MEREGLASSAWGREAGKPSPDHHILYLLSASAAHLPSLILSPRQQLPFSNVLFHLNQTEFILVTSN